MTNRPDLIIFDLGNVIVNIDPLAVASRLANASERSSTDGRPVLPSTIRELSSSLVSAFDEGRLTPRAFYEEMASRVRLKLDFQGFVRIWNSGFSENHAVSAIVARLARHFRLFILSNTNTLHFEYIKSAYPVINKMEAAVLSYRIGCRKPATAIYEHALRLAGLPPERVWYVDDVPEFVEAAAQCGIHAVQYCSPQQLNRDLGAILDGS